VGTFSDPPECSQPPQAFAAPKGWVDNGDGAPSHAKCMCVDSEDYPATPIWLSLLSTLLGACLPVGLYILSVVELYDEKVKCSL